MEGIFVSKNVSVKLFNFFNGMSIGNQERVCQILQILQWGRYWWSGKVSVKLVGFFNVGSIGDQERVCQIVQLFQWRDYWRSRTCMSNSSASLTVGIFVFKNVSVNLFSLFNWGSIGDQLCVWQTGLLFQWREYLWSRTCLSNISASSIEGVLVIKDVSVKLFSFFNGGIIGDQERVCQTLQILQWRKYCCTLWLTFFTGRYTFFQIFCKNFFYDRALWNRLFARLVLLCGNDFSKSCDMSSDLFVFVSLLSVVSSLILSPSRNFLYGSTDHPLKPSTHFTQAFTSPGFDSIALSYIYLKINQKIIHLSLISITTVSKYIASLKHYL